MRLISQNGAIDVPYEMSAIRNDDNLIILCMAGETGKGSVIATYSTSEKAEKAMEMLRDAYVGTPIVVSDREYTQDEINAMLLETCVLSIQKEPPRIIESQHGYFQFPQDEDVEV